MVSERLEYRRIYRGIDFSKDVIADIIKRKLVVLPDYRANHKPCSSVIGPGKIIYF